MPQTGGGHKCLRAACGAGQRGLWPAAPAAYIGAMRNAMMWCLLACAACDKGAAPAPSATGGAAATGGGGAAPTGERQSMLSASTEMIGPLTPAAAASERKTRIFECAFVKIDGEGKERRAVFQVKNLGDRVPDGAQAWIYYYDQADKLLARYPHRFFTSAAPGATEEQALGHAGASIPKGTATAECEISKVDWKDKTEWANANLVPDAIERPRGGFSHEQLLEREGERVTATWTGNVDGTPVLVLENVSPRPLTVKVVWVYQYDEAGKQLERSVSNVSIDLPPRAKVEQKLGPKALEPGAKYVEAAVPDVRFRDGKQEEWRNDNLVPLAGRPMKGPIAGKPAQPAQP